MHLTRLMARRAAAVAAIAIATALAGGTPAQASDASLRKAVVEQERKLDAVQGAFDKATRDTVSAVGREQAQTALSKLRTAVRRQKAAVTKQRATSAKLKRARTQYLAAVTSFLAGLGTFGQGLEVFDPDAPAKAKALIAKAKTQLESAALRRERLRKLIVARS